MDIYDIYASKESLQKSFLLSICFINISKSAVFPLENLVTITELPKITPTVFEI